MRKIFTVRAVWDEEAGIYYSDSDISGLHIEADNLEEFERDLFDVAAELIVASHMTPAEIAVGVVVASGAVGMPWLVRPG